MAKSPTFSLAQWVFLLAVIWVAVFFAAKMLREKGITGAPPTGRGVEVPESPPEGSVEWLPPVDVVAVAQPERSDQALWEESRGKSLAEIAGSWGDSDREVIERSWEAEPLRMIDAEDAGMVAATFRDRLPEAGLEIVAQNLINGSSRLGLFDLDGDGYRDVQGPLEMRFFRNRADGTFETEEEAVSAGFVPGAEQVAAADYDNDGDLDLFAGRRGRWWNSLLQNSGDGEFQDVCEGAGVLEFRETVSAAWVDFDRDGWIDLFVASNPAGGGDDPCCRLFRNRGDGSFREIAWVAGLRFAGNVRDSAWGDLDGDGFPDLVISTVEAAEAESPGEAGEPDAGQAAPLLVFRSVPADRIENWRFEPIAAGSGLAEIEDAGRLMLADFDQDGWVDLVSGGGTWSPGRIFRNHGLAEFEDVTGVLGLGELSGVLSLEVADLDGDGSEDLALGTDDGSGNRLFLNRRGDSFREVSGAAGIGIFQATPAIRAGDLDGDGDLDLAVAADWTAGALLENPGAESHAWLSLDLEGTTANRAAIGARISLVVRDRDWILHRIERTARESRIEIGLGEAESIESLEIEWPVVGWPRSRFTEVPLNRLIRIREGDAEFGVTALPPFRFSGTESEKGKGDES